MNHLRCTSEVPKSKFALNENDKNWAYEEAVWPNSEYYPASCLKEIGEKKETLSQENHFPPEIQTRYGTNTSQKHYSFSQLVCAHGQNFYLY